MHSNPVWHENCSSKARTSAVNVGNRECSTGTARTENREMNGIIQDQKTFQASRNLQSLDAAPSSLTHIREGKEYHARQILVDRSFLQDEFADEREYAHCGINEY